MNALKHLFIILFVVTSFSCSDSNSTNDTSESNLNPNDYFEELNISYGPDAKQTFDLYLPANRTMETKVLILIHGGGWTSGDKSDMLFLKEIIRQDLPNMAIVNLNYRLADDNTSPFPMQINDINSAIDVLKEINDAYVFSEDYGFIGVSAGAHLSMLWSYAHDTDHNSKMVCSIVGPTNFTDPAYLNSTEPYVQTLMALYRTDVTTAFLEEVSPFHQATSSAPPTILFYGGQDPIVPTSQGTDMRDKLLQLGVTNEFTLYPTAGHGWTGPELLDTRAKLNLFIQTHL